MFFVLMMLHGVSNDEYEPRYRGQLGEFSHHATHVFTRVV